MPELLDTIDEILISVIESEHNGLENEKFEDETEVLSNRYRQIRNANKKHR